MSNGQRTVPRRDASDPSELYSGDILDSVMSGKYSRIEAQFTQTGIPIAQKQSRRVPQSAASVTPLNPAIHQKASSSQSVPSRQHTSTLTQSTVASRGGAPRYPKGWANAQTAPLDTPAPAPSPPSPASTQPPSPPPPSSSGLNAAVVASMSSRRRAWRQRSSLETQTWTSTEHVALVKRLSEAVDLLIADWREKHRADAEDIDAAAAIRSGSGTGGAPPSTADPEAEDDAQDGLVVKRVLKSLASGAHEQLLLMNVLKRVTEPVALTADARGDGQAPADIGDGDADALLEEYLLCPSPCLRALLHRVATHVTEYMGSVQYALGTLMHRVDSLVTVANIKAKHSTLKGQLRRDLCDTLASELDAEVLESERWHAQVEEERLKYRCVEAAIRNGLEYDAPAAGGGAGAGPAAAPKPHVARMVQKLVRKDGLPTLAAPMIPREEWVWHHSKNAALDKASSGSASGSSSASAGSLVSVPASASLPRLLAMEDPPAPRTRAAVLRETAAVLAAGAGTEAGAVGGSEDEEGLYQRLREIVEKQVHAQSVAEVGAGVGAAGANTNATAASVLFSKNPSGNAPLPAPVLVSPLVSGAAQVAAIAAASHYYRVPVGADDATVLLTLTQLSPAAGINNYVQVSARQGAPPTVTEYEVLIGTMPGHGVSLRGGAGDKRGLVESLCSRADADRGSTVSYRVPCRGAGNVFFRVTAHGVDVKRYKLTARVLPLVPDFSSALGRLAEDLDVQVRWQETVGEKLVQLGAAKDAEEERRREEEQKEREREEVERRRRRAARKYRDHLLQLQSKEEESNKQM